MTAGGFDGAATIGRFHVEGVLGQGGMGVVIAARDPELDRRVAIKLLLDGHGTDGQLDREAQAMARLAHPNVITVYEVGNHDKRRYIAMELVEGATLRGWVAAGNGAGARSSRCSKAPGVASKRRIALAWSIATSSPRT